MKFITHSFCTIFPHDSECRGQLPGEISMKLEPSISDVYKCWIEWFQHVQNDEVRQTTKQRRLSATVHSQCVSVFGRTTRMPHKVDAKKVNIFSRWQLRRSHIMRLKIIQHNLKSNKLSHNEATDMAQNRPLWTLMSAFGAMHSYG